MNANLEFTVYLTVPSPKGAQSPNERSRTHYRGQIEKALYGVARDTGLMGFSVSPGNIVAEGHNIFIEHKTT